MTLYLTASSCFIKPFINSIYITVVSFNFFNSNYSSVTVLSDKHSQSH